MIREEDIRLLATRRVALLKQRKLLLKLEIILCDLLESQKKIKEKISEERQANLQAVLEYELKKRLTDEGAQRIASIDAKIAEYK